MIRLLNTNNPVPNATSASPITEIRLRTRFGLRGRRAGRGAGASCGT
jgi:hypothetical protein